MTDQDFIGVYDQALPAATCAALVARFHASGEDRPGRVGAGVMPELKDSRDIGISGKPAWRDAEQALIRRCSAACWPTCAAPRTPCWRR